MPLHCSLKFFVWLKMIRNFSLQHVFIGKKCYKETAIICVDFRKCSAGKSQNKMLYVDIWWYLFILEFWKFACLVCGWKRMCDILKWHPEVNFLKLILYRQFPVYGICQKYFAVKIIFGFRPKIFRFLPACCISFFYFVLLIGYSYFQFLRAETLLCTVPKTGGFYLCSQDYHNKYDLNNYYLM